MRLVFIGQTNHPMLINLIRAREINRLAGSPIVKPWDLDDLSDEWLDMFDLLQEQMDNKANA